MLGNVIGQVDIDYNVSVGPVRVDVVWELHYVYPSPVNGVGSFSVGFKSAASPETATVTVTPILRSASTVSSNFQNRAYQ